MKVIIPYNLLGFHRGAGRQNALHEWQKAFPEFNLHLYFDIFTLDKKGWPGSNTFLCSMLVTFTR
jgi:hypothetical protein